MQKLLSIFMFNQEAKKFINLKGIKDINLSRGWQQKVVKRFHARKRKGTHKNESYLLVWDSFSVHKDTTIINLLSKEYDTDVAIIPRGCTPVLQPLDVGINQGSEWPSPKKGFTVRADGNQDRHLEKWYPPKSRIIEVIFFLNVIIFKIPNSLIKIYIF